MSGRLLLDTCTFLWLAAAPQRISAAAREAIDDSGNARLLSDVSIWEIVLKHRTGKLPLPAEPSRWVPAQAAFFQLQRLAIEPAAIYLSGTLPGVHPDPFDRLLAAQACSLDMPIVTPDAPLRQLGAATIW